jgi:hypothetical protein
MPILWWGAGSYPTSGHVTRKRTVNTTLARGHHAETWRTARNFFFFHTLAIGPKLFNIIFLTGEDEYSQDRFPVIQLALLGLA